MTPHSCKHRTEFILLLTSDSFWRTPKNYTNGSNVCAIEYDCSRTPSLQFSRLSRTSSIHCYRRTCSSSKTPPTSNPISGARRRAQPQCLIRIVLDHRASHPPVHSSSWRRTSTRPTRRMCRPKKRSQRIYWMLLVCDALSWFTCISLVVRAYRHAQNWTQR